MNTGSIAVVFWTPVWYRVNDAATRYPQNTTAKGGEGYLERKQITRSSRTEASAVMDSSNKDTTYFDNEFKYCRLTFRLLKLLKFAEELLSTVA